MKAFELWISGVRSNCSASCAITRALHLLCFLFLALTTCYLHNWHKEDFFTSVSTIGNYDKNYCDWSHPANLGPRKKHFWATGIESASSSKALNVLAPSVGVVDCHRQSFSLQDVIGCIWLKGMFSLHGNGCESHI